MTHYVNVSFSELGASFGIFFLSPEIFIYFFNLIQQELTPYVQLIYDLLIRIVNLSNAAFIPVKQYKKQTKIYLYIEQNQKNLLYLEYEKIIIGVLSFHLFAGTNSEVAFKALPSRIRSETDRGSKKNEEMCQGGKKLETRNQTRQSC